MFITFSSKCMMMFTKEGVYPYTVTNTSCSITFHKPHELQQHLLALDIFAVYHALCFLVKCVYTHGYSRIYSVRPLFS